MQNYLAQQADTAANEAVIQPKKPKDVAQSGDLSILVEIDREILVLLKCILALVLLVVVGIVYISDAFINLYLLWWHACCINN